MAGLNSVLSSFAQATAHCGDTMRITMRNNLLAPDTGDVGVFRRFFHLRQSTQDQIVENNKVRTHLLNALTAQFKDRGGIPDSVKAQLIGSSLLGRDDMMLDADNNVCSGRPLTARRVRQILEAVKHELEDANVSQPPNQTSENSKKLEKGPLESKDLKTESHRVETKKVNPGEAKATEQWRKTYCQQFLIRKRDQYKTEGADPLLWEGLESNVHLANKMVDRMEKAHVNDDSQVTQDLTKQFDDMVTAEIKEVEDAFAWSLDHRTNNPKVAATGVKFKEINLAPGSIFKQTLGGNMCPIIGTINAMMISGGECANRVRDALTPKSDKGKTYYEFTHVGEDEETVRVEDSDIERYFGNRAGTFSDIEKVVFAALKKAELVEENAGNTFEAYNVFQLMGLGNPEPFGRFHVQDGMSKGQLCTWGKQVAEAINAGKPCVMGVPGHFVAVDSVTFDDSGMPTIRVIESSVEGDLPVYRSYSHEELKKMSFWFNVAQ